MQEVATIIYQWEKIVLYKVWPLLQQWWRLGPYIVLDVRSRSLTTLDDRIRAWTDATEGAVAASNKHHGILSI